MRFQSLYRLSDRFSLNCSILCLSIPALPSFCNDFQIAVIHHPFTNWQWLCHFLLQSSHCFNGCDKILWLDNRSPLLHSHYRNFFTTMASSDASCCISHLWWDWVAVWTVELLLNSLHYRFLQSFWHINKIASHVPNKSLCKAPAALMPVSL